MKINRKLVIGGIILLIGILVLVRIIGFYLDNKNINYKNIWEGFNDYKLPKKIWTYWNDVNIPENISKILNYNKNKLEPEWEINLLNDNNLNQYIDINKFPEKYNNLGVQHKADLIRLMLLEKYGGVWMDATVVINSKDEFNKLYDNTVAKKSEFTGFTLHNKNDSFKYHQYIENWFIMAPENSKFIRLLLKEYITAINMEFEKYGKYIIDELKINIGDEIKNFGNYLTQHKCIQTVIQKYDGEPNILLYKSEDSMFKPFVDCGWNNECVNKKFENNKNELRNIPYLKFTGQFRNNIDFNKFLE